MSDMQTTDQAKQAADQKPQLPDPETAYQNVFNGVHGQVFFSKLASAYGIEPQSEQEARSLLLLAGRLRLADQTKQADDRFGQWLPALDEALGQAGYGGQVKAAEDQDAGLAFRQAACHFASDPTIYNSVLALKAHEASMAG